MEKLKALLKKIINRETITYVIFGVLTTAVNFAFFHICNKLLTDDVFLKDKNYLFSNILAWIAAVLFAFFTNKLFVFKSKSWKAKTVVREFVSFIGARLFSLGVDEGGMFLFVSVLNFNKMIAKLIVQVAIVLINYFFSKFLIFKNKKEENKEG
ncbi:MAG: GtrA family protein [Clostridiales bacterium]|nr:GtrA family protein [Clostridiales bacterium]